MRIYLPIAELPVSIFLILGLGAAVGFISGMFGVGGGFLMTPLLIFLGIPPAVVVATGTAQIAASSLTGSLAYWRRRALDVRLGSVLLAGGLVGTVAGVAFFNSMRRVGQLDLVITLSYITLLGSIGSLMLVESTRALISERRGGAPPLRRAGQHAWFLFLPVRMRFYRSRLYASILPLLALSFTIGFLGAVLGIGGGFLMVPALIYLFRVPTAIVIGTSLFQILFTMIAAVILHAVTNQSVDVILGIILIVGGVFGAQFGARAGQNIRGQQFRLLLALIILAVGVRFGSEIALRPGRAFLPRPGRGASVTRPGALIAVMLAAWIAASAPAAGEALVSTISSSHVQITSTYTGAELVVFGVIERDGRVGARTEPYDVVVTARGPDGNAVVREKVRFGPIWMNLDQRKFVSVPATLAVLSNRPVKEIAETHLRRRYRLGLDMQVGPGGTDVAWDAAFLDALLRLKREAGLYVERPAAVQFLTPSIFKATVPVPGTAPVGTYRVEVALLTSGLELARTETGFEVGKVGFEAAVARYARLHRWLYGLITVAIALAFGYTASIIFRRD